MKKSLNRYKENLERTLTAISWATWNRLGTYGSGGENQYCVDIEAAILLVAYIGWLDGRLFDGALSWIKKYQEIVNPERLMCLIKDSNDTFLASCVGAMIESTLDGKDSGRWASFLKRLKKFIPAKIKTSENLWIPKRQASWIKKDEVFFKWGITKEQTSLTYKLKSHQTILHSNAIIVYRYLFGVSARPDVLYLIKTATDIGHGITTSQIAGILGYNHSSIFRIIQSLETGEIIESYSKNQKKDIRWRLTPSFKLSKDMKPEKGVINWRQLVIILLQLFKIIETLNQIPSEELIKHTLYNFHKESFPILYESGFTYISPPPTGPLVQYSSEDLLTSIEIFVIKLAKDICTPI